MNNVTVVFWSASGNTEAMAEAIAEGAKSAGSAITYKNVADITPEEALAADALALGCPAMGDEVLEEGEFEPFFSALEPALSGKKVAIFGSYGWGDGQWMRDWQERTKKAGALLLNGEGLMLNEMPDDEGLAVCREFGAALASF